MNPFSHSSQHHHHTYTPQIQPDISNNVRPKGYNHCNCFVKNSSVQFNNLNSDYKMPTRATITTRAHCSSLRSFLAASLLLSTPCLSSSFLASQQSLSISKPINTGAANNLAKKERAIHLFLSTCTRTTSSLKMSDPLAELNLPTPLILGSGSFTRKLILKEMQIPFILKVRPIDERNIGDRSDGSDPSHLVMTIAKAKSQALISALLDPNTINGNSDSGGDSDSIIEDKYDMTLTQKEWIVLTADQVVTNSNSILEKPDNIEQAKEFVSKYAASPPSTVGSVILTHFPSNISVSGVDISTIHFKPSLGGAYGELIDRLLEDGAPVLSCAGGLMVEHPFVVEFIDRIDGTQDGVMGLSKDLVLRLLKELKEELEKDQ
jgi:septum formation protein